MILTTLATPDGPFSVLLDADSVWASGWTASASEVVQRVRTAERPSEIIEVAPDDPRLTAVREAVADYYDGDFTAVQRIGVRQFGTAFQQRGWQQLRRIPPGRPLSYAEFAAGLGNPGAVRAVASICARNAPALFVPCHRVLRSDGSLGGFAWGVEIKRALLQREGAFDLPADGGGARPTRPVEERRTPHSAG